ncbi:MAG: hypothetical protein ABIC95_03500 [archaeon]
MNERRNWFGWVKKFRRRSTAPELDMPESPGTPVQDILTELEILNKLNQESLDLALKKKGSDAVERINQLWRKSREHTALSSFSNPNNDDALIQAMEDFSIDFSEVRWEPSTNDDDDTLADSFGETDLASMNIEMRDAIIGSPTEILATLVSLYHDKSETIARLESLASELDIYARNSVEAVERSFGQARVVIGEKLQIIQTQVGAFMDQHNTTRCLLNGISLPVTDFKILNNGRMTPAEGTENSPEKWAQLLIVVTSSDEAQDMEMVAKAVIVNEGNGAELNQKLTEIITALRKVKLPGWKAELIKVATISQLEKDIRETMILTSTALSSGETSEAEHHCGVIKSKCQELETKVGALLAQHEQTMRFVGEAANKSRPIQEWINAAMEALRNEARNYVTPTVTTAGPTPGTQAQTAADGIPDHELLTTLITSMDQVTQLSEQLDTDVPAFRGWLMQELQRIGTQTEQTAALQKVWTEGQERYQRIQADVTNMYQLHQAMKNSLNRMVIPGIDYDINDGFEATEVQRGTDQEVWNRFAAWALVQLPEEKNRIEQGNEELKQQISTEQLPGFRTVKTTEWNQLTQVIVRLLSDFMVLEEAWTAVGQQARMNT